METIKDTLITLYSEIIESYYAENELSQIRKSMTFYEFVEIMLNRFKDKCTNIDSENLTSIIKKDFLGNCTKQRFLNALTRIIDKYKIILQKTYQGDFKSAIKHMEELMHSKKHLSKYLDDIYINYLIGNIENNIILYRMRDVKKEEKPNDCWHIPFSLRRSATLQRYNMSGHPCLYLADSKETAEKELGSITENYNRWYSEFNTKQSISIFDLTIPSPKLIQNENNNSDLFGWLITYPLRMLCSIKVYEKTNFPEEYIFPQLLFHWMYMMNGYNYRDGFVYSSTKNPNGKNYVFPAKYTTKTPPKYSDYQIDKKLQAIFKASIPELLYKEKKIKRYSIEITKL